jgi:hypothetical protein
LTLSPRTQPCWRRCPAAAQQCGQHLAGLVAVIVDRLLAQDDQAGAFLFLHLGEQLGDAQRFDFVIGLDQDGAVRTHGERRAQRFLRFGSADRYRHDLGRRALFLQTNGFLDGDFVERVHAHLDVGQVHARAIRLHARLHIVIDNPLHGHKDLHQDILSVIEVSLRIHA